MYQVEYLKNGNVEINASYAEKDKLTMYSYLMLWLDADKIRDIAVNSNCNTNLFVYQSTRNPAFKARIKVTRDTA